MKPRSHSIKIRLICFARAWTRSWTRKPPLFMLANQVDWSVFDHKYADKERPALPTRLMVGVHYLKHVARPLDPSSLARWRKRIGPNFANHPTLLALSPTYSKVVENQKSARTFVDR